MNGFSIIDILIIGLIVSPLLAVAVGLWGVFKKANRPGWVSLVPIVNLYLLHSVAGCLGLRLIVDVLLLALGIVLWNFDVVAVFKMGIGTMDFYFLVIVLLAFLILALASIFLWFCCSVRLSTICGKGFGFGVGLFFLPCVFYPILGLGNSNIRSNPNFGWLAKVGDNLLPFEFNLALRYLSPKRTAVSFITLISVLGVMLGVMVLIIVTSVFSGFHLQLKKTFFQFSADIQVGQITVVEEGGSKKLLPVPMGHYDELTNRLSNIKGIKGAIPIIGGKVMLETQPDIGEPVFDAPQLIGVDAAGMETVSQVPRSMVEGEFDLRGNGLVVGFNFGRDDGMFQLDVGDRVLIYSPQNMKEMKDAQEQNESLGILPEEYTVRGVFDAGQGELNNFIFCSIPNAQDLYRMDDVAHSIWVETDDPLNLGPTVRKLQSELGGEYVIGTWEDINPVLLAQVEVEKLVTQFLMFFIVIVAAFGIASSLIIFGVQKTKEIGLLKALGATNGQVSNVFLIQSAVVGVLGTAFGVGLGMLVLKYRNEFLGFWRGKGVELFPEKLYGFRDLPAQIVQGDVVIICGVSLLICILAGLLPAWNAARLQPVEALRNE